MFVKCTVHFSIFQVSFKYTTSVQLSFSYPEASHLGSNQWKKESNCSEQCSVWHKQWTVG